MVNDQRRVTQLALARADAGRPRRRVLGRIAIAVAAFAAVVGPHFVSGSPTTNDDTDPTNGLTQDVPEP
jgi:hypothetical protein